jgi:hypothetical protein
MTIDPQEFGELKATTKSIGDGIGRIETMLTDHVQVTRDTHRNLYTKVDKAHERVDDVKQELSGIKGKIAVFTALVGAAWAYVMKLITGE